jgi:DNA-binding Lrp family transcriptional regulator
MIDRIAKEHGRKAGRNRVAQILRAKYGKVNGLSEQEITDAIAVAKMRRMPLTREKVRQIWNLLSANQRALPYARMSIAQIQAIVSSRLAPVSGNHIRMLNQRVRKVMREVGLRVTKFTRQGLKFNDKKILASLRAVLLADLSISFPDAAKRLNLHPTSLQRIFKRNKTYFAKIRSEMYVKAIRDLDLRTNFSLTNAEVAAKLKMKPGTVERYRKLGKRIAGRNRVNKVSNRILSWLGGFTTPEEGFLEFRALVALTGESSTLVRGVLTKLVNKRLVLEVEANGNGVFRISMGGVRSLNANGNSSSSRLERIRGMSIEESKKIRARLIDASFSAGVGVTGSIIRDIEELISRKLREQNLK